MTALKATFLDPSEFVVSRPVGNIRIEGSVTLTPGSVN